MNEPTLFPLDERYQTRGLKPPAVEVPPTSAPGISPADAQKAIEATRAALRAAVPNGVAGALADGESGSGLALNAGADGADARREPPPAKKRKAKKPI